MKNKTEKPNKDIENSHIFDEISMIETPDLRNLNNKKNSKKLSNALRQNLIRRKEEIVDSNPIWEELHDKLPWHLTEDQKQKRLEIWRLIDKNSNGMLSLAEVDLGMRDVIKLPALFALKPVLLRAFTAAKNKVKSTTKKSFNAEDYGSKGEFRFLLKYLR